MKYLKNVFAAMMCAAMVITGLLGASSMTAVAATDEEIATAAAELETAKKELADAEAILVAKQEELDNIEASIQSQEKVVQEKSAAFEQSKAERAEINAQVKVLMDELIALLKENEIDPHGGTVNIDWIGRTPAGDPVTGIQAVDDKIAEYSAMVKQSIAATRVFLNFQSEFNDAKSELENLEASKNNIMTLLADATTAVQNAQSLVADKQNVYDSLVASATPVKLPFDDVSEDAWYYDVVSDVFQKGLMTGMNATTFAPDLTLNRAFLAAVLYRRAGSPAVEYSAVFPDVPADEWFTQCVLWARKAGVILGYDEGNFGPTDSLKREQLCTILWRCALEMDGLDNGARTSIDSYPDATKITDFAVEAIQWCEAMGILNYRDGRIAAWEEATRADCAWMISKYLEATGQNK